VPNDDSAPFADALAACVCDAIADVASYCDCQPVTVCIRDTGADPDADCDCQSCADDDPTADTDY